MNRISDKEIALNGGNFRISESKSLILKIITEVNEDGKQQI